MDNLRSRLKLDSLRLKAGLSPLWGKGKKSNPGTALVTIEKPAVIEEPAPAITPKDVANAILDVRDLLKEQESEGEVNTYNLTLTTERKDKEFRHPVTRELKPLITATIYNDGPDTGYFQINYPGSKVITLKNGESVSPDFTKSKRKFERVFYYTAAGGNASVRVVGKY